MSYITDLRRAVGHCASWQKGHIMSTTYTAAIAHHSISRARVITIDGTLTKAKRAATKEFGAEQRDYHIVIRNMHGETAAVRRVGDARWSV
jgi:hypothetical protein